MAAWAGFQGCCTEFPVSGDFAGERGTWPGKQPLDAGSWAPGPWPWPQMLTGSGLLSTRRPEVPDLLKVLPLAGRYGHRCKDLTVQEASCKGLDPFPAQVTPCKYASALTNPLLLIL